VNPIDDGKIKGFQQHKTLISNIFKEWLFEKGNTEEISS